MRTWPCLSSHARRLVSGVQLENPDSGETPGVGYGHEGAIPANPAIPPQPEPAGDGTRVGTSFPMTADNSQRSRSLAQAQDVDESSTLPLVAHPPTYDVSLDPLSSFPENVGITEQGAQARNELPQWFDEALGNNVPASLDHVPTSSIAADSGGPSPHADRTDELTATVLGWSEAHLSAPAADAHGGVGHEPDTGRGAEAVPSASIGSWAGEVVFSQVGADAGIMTADHASMDGDLVHQSQAVPSLGAGFEASTSTAMLSGGLLPEPAIWEGSAASVPRTAEPVWRINAEDALPVPPDHVSTLLSVDSGTASLYADRPRTDEAAASFGWPGFALSVPGDLAAAMVSDLRSGVEATLSMSNGVAGHTLPAGAAAEEVMDYDQSNSTSVHSRASRDSPIAPALGAGMEGDQTPSGGFDDATPLRTAADNKVVYSVSGADTTEVPSSRTRWPNVNSSSQNGQYENMTSNGDGYVASDDEGYDNDDDSDDDSVNEGFGDSGHEHGDEAPDVFLVAERTMDFDIPDLAPRADTSSNVLDVDGIWAEEIQGSSFMTRHADGAAISNATISTASASGPQASRVSVQPSPTAVRSLTPLAQLLPERISQARASAAGPARREHKRGGSSSSGSEEETALVSLPCLTKVVPQTSLSCTQDDVMGVLSNGDRVSHLCSIPFVTVPVG